MLITLEVHDQQELDRIVGWRKGGMEAGMQELVLWPGHFKRFPTTLPCRAVPDVVAMPGELVATQRENSCS